MSDVSSSPRQNGVVSDESSDEASSRSQTRRAAPAMDVHQPGSIVRIRMKNFVTYSSAEFKCGPNLNMIIGPNGTGKSSLVCAICLGLGWSANFLGRAKDVGEYVKHGSKQAEIEIELKAGVNHRRNPVVRRVIKREGNKTSWSINGSSASHKDVRKLAYQFNIQVDNLCQFLPQDRVVEFAAMTPVQLLEQTQKAVGTEQMVKWHRSLTTLSKERKDLVAKKNTAAQKLHDLQKVQTRQKADVDRMQERVQLQRRLDALEQLKPTVIGQQYVREYRELRAKKIEVAGLVQRLKAESQPHLDEVESKKGYRRQIKAVLDHHKKMLESARRKADRTAKEGDHLKGRIGDCDNQISSKRKAKVERTKGIASIQAKIAALEEKLKSPPPEFSEQELNEKRRALSSQGRENADQLLEIGARTRVDVEKMQASASQKNRLLGELKGLSTMSGRQMQKLKNRSMDTFRAWQWIEEHRDRFQSEVFAPPIVSCSVKRPEYADAIETAMQQNDFLAITVTNQQDFKLLSNQLYNQMGLQDITLRTSSRPLGEMQRPVGDTALKQEFGFDGWLIDGLEGPEPVLAMLCGSARLHSCAFTLRTLSEDRLRQLQNSNIQQWCTKDEMCSIQRRKEYGPAAVSTTVRRLGTARFWTDQGVDPGRQAELEAELAEAEESFEQVKKTVQEAQAVMKEKKAHAEVLKEEIRTITQTKERLQRARSEFEGIPIKIDGNRTELDRKMAAQAETDDEIRDLVRKKEDFAVERAKTALTFISDMQRVRAVVKDLLHAELVHIEAESDVASLEARNSDMTRLLKEKEREEATLKVETVRVKRLAVEHRQAGYDAMHELDEDMQIMQRAFLERYTDPTMDQLEAEMTSTRGRLELVSPGDPRVLAEYEKRAGEIEEAGRLLASVDSIVEEKGREIDETRARWEPRLDRLVERISKAFAYNFEQIGCAGSVAVHKDEEYSKWAILIQVRFREGEQLSLLDSQRQSGGERAVSTIFYLMALQALARAPFRVVDEINQGMDPRNERLVHERMVAVACADAVPERDDDDDDDQDEGEEGGEGGERKEDGRAGGSQYFLITPKLLAGLQYHERMKVHTIFSGESMPAEQEAGTQSGPVLDLAALADRAMTIRGKA